MRSLPAEALAALASGSCMPRDFIWLVARDRTTGAPVADGQWSGLGTIEAAVLNPDTGDADTRTFYGSGTLTQVSGISLVSVIQVQTATIHMAQVHDRVNELLRGYDCKQARVEIYRGLFSPETGNLITPAFCRFVGFVNEAPVFTPPQNRDGGRVELRCTSHTQELLRASAELRSDESQQRRFPGDRFFQHVHVVAHWEHFQGKSAGRLPSTAGASK
jgi:hypothetical protein